MTRTVTALALMAGLAVASGAAFADEGDKPTSDEARSMFLKLDTNGNGEISAAEASAHEGVGGAMDDADANGDGVLSWEEFRAYTMKEMSGEESADDKATEG